MSLVPSEQPAESLVERTQVKPIDMKDPPGLFHRFLDALRKTIGLRPLHLAERFAAVRVQREEVEARNCEIDGEMRLLQGKIEYERAMAEIRQGELEAQGRFLKDSAEAAHLRAQTEALSTDLRDAIERLKDATNVSPEDNLDWLQSVIQRIRFCGGEVEIDANDSSTALPQVENEGDSQREPKLPK